jgi:hypothetical protein
MRSGFSPIRLAIACAKTVTRDEWPREYGSRASIAAESAARLPTELDSSSLARGSLQLGGVACDADHQAAGLVPVAVGTDRSTRLTK